MNHFFIYTSRERNGFTLTELIIVVAILGILSLIAVPNIIGELPNYRIKAASRDIASRLLLARMKAISRNCQYRIAFDPAGSYTVMRNDPVTGWVQEGEAFNLPAAVRFNRGGADPITFSSDRVVFNPNGSSNVNGAIYLKNSRDTMYHISVLQSTGRVSLEKGW